MVAFAPLRVRQKTHRYAAIIEKKIERFLYESTRPMVFDDGKPPLTDHFPAHGSAEDRMDDHQCYLLNQLADINPKRTISLLFVELFMNEAIRAGSIRGAALVYR